MDRQQRRRRGRVIVLFLLFKIREIFRGRIVPGRFLNLSSLLCKQIMNNFGHSCTCRGDPFSAPGRPGGRPPYWMYMGELRAGHLGPTYERELRGCTYVRAGVYTWSRSWSPMYIQELHPALLVHNLFTIYSFLKLEIF